MLHLTKRCWMRCKAFHRMFWRELSTRERVGLIAMFTLFLLAEWINIHYGTNCRVL